MTDEQKLVLIGLQPKVVRCAITLSDNSLLEPTIHLDLTGTVARIFAIIFNKTIDWEVKSTVTLEDLTKKIADHNTRLNLEFNSRLNVELEISKLQDSGLDREIFDAPTDPTFWPVINKDMFPPARTTRPAGLKCKNCSQFDHLVENCPRPLVIKVCSTCCDPTHSFKQCRLCLNVRHYCIHN